MVFGNESDGHVGKSVFFFSLLIPFALYSCAVCMIYICIHLSIWLGRWPLLSLLPSPHGIPLLSNFVPFSTFRYMVSK